ncbi:MAG: hypothetical protein QNJ42_22140 [Crocosphaera sp.]|nr:hypothetical protein [Crocosphaera sp.]
MASNVLGPQSLQLLLSILLPRGCRLSVVSDKTYRINCPDYESAHIVWENRINCIYPLLSPGEVVEVVASDYYARSYPKPS